MDPQSETHDGSDGSDGTEGPAPQHPAVNADGTLAIAQPDVEGLHPNAVTVARALAHRGVVGGLVATISILPGRPWEWNCSASWSEMVGRVRLGGGSLMGMC